MSEPSTAAGKKLLARLHDRAMALGGLEDAGADWWDTARALPEVEAEAREQATTGLREALDAKSFIVTNGDFDRLHGRSVVQWSDICAALAAAPPQAEPRWPSADDDEAVEAAVETLYPLDTWRGTWNREHAVLVARAITAGEQTGCGCGLDQPLRAALREREGERDG